MEVQNLNVNAITIPEFFSGLSVFITGGSGFMGKVLVEKLLRSCPEIDKMYILIRPKKNQTPAERIENIFKTPLMKLISPEVIAEKVVPVIGNSEDLQFGIDDETKAILQEKVNVIFHVAASVRFDDTLKYATLVNVRAAREIINLAKGMRDLKSLLHVSTSYSNTHQYTIEEKMYPAPIDWRTLIRLVEELPDDILRVITPKILGKYPNTYTFSKSVAEQVMNDAYKDNLPVTIVRPSIVVSSIKEPFPGWMDNFNGPIGLMTAVAKGALRTIYADLKINADFMPVDIAINAWIIIASNTGLNKNTGDEVPVFNVSSSDFKKITVYNLLEYSKPFMDQYPVENQIWKPMCFFTKSFTLYWFSFIFLHLIPGYCLDFVLILMGRKPILNNILRRIYFANISISYFMFNEWVFKVRNVFEIEKLLSKSDLEVFKIDYRDTDIMLFVKEGLLGAKKYIFKEDMNNLENAKRASKRLAILHNIVLICFAVAAFYLVKSINLHGLIPKIYNNYVDYIFN